MHSKKTKIHENINKLLQSFKKEKTLSVADIMACLSCSHSSAYNYIQRLKDKGYAFHTYTQKKKAFFQLLNNEASLASDSEIEYLPLTANILRKYTLIEELQGNPIKKTDFAKHFSLSGDRIEADDNKPQLDIQLTYFYELVNQLRYEQEIVLDPYDNKYYLTGKKIPLILSLNVSRLYDLYDELSTISQGHPYYSQLFSIYQKLAFYLGNLGQDISSFDNYISYGRKQVTFNTIPSKLHPLFEKDYQTKILEIDYCSKKGNKTHFFFRVGMILYAMEKDVLYLLGDSMKSLDEKDTVHSRTLNLDGILSVKETPLSHDKFKSPSYQKQFDYMFSISDAPPVEVKVSFDCIGNVRDKIHHLKLQRKYAKVIYQKESNSLLYTDTISGLPDFANYLRQFGKSVHVQEPKALKNMMKSSINKSLAHYQEEA